MKIIKDNWITILVAAILIFVLLHSQNKYKEFELQVTNLENSNKLLEKQSKLYLDEIDSLSKIDTIIIKEIEYIKIKEDEATTAVDTMSISNLQSYFTGRYKK